jgi:hypothetical protein
MNTAAYEMRTSRLKIVLSISRFIKWSDYWRNNAPEFLAFFHFATCSNKLHFFEQRNKDSRSEEVIGSSGLRGGPTWIQLLFQSRPSASDLDDELARSRQSHGKV